MKIKVEFTSDVPVNATSAEIEAWVEFCLGATHSLSNENPLVEYEIEADSFSVRMSQ